VPLFHFFDESAWGEGEDEQQDKKYKHLANLNKLNSKQKITSINCKELSQSKGFEIQNLMNKIKFISNHAL
jgi:hypothetical protein